MHTHTHTHKYCKCTPLPLLATVSDLFMEMNPALIRICIAPLFPSFFLSSLTFCSRFSLSHERNASKESNTKRMRWKCTTTTVIQASNGPGIANEWQIVLCESLTVLHNPSKPCLHQTVTPWLLFSHPAPRRCRETVRIQTTEQFNIHWTSCPTELGCAKGFANRSQSFHF